MTIKELRNKLLELKYPTSYEVDAETYALACDYIFKHHINPDHFNYSDIIMIGNNHSIRVTVGPNGGLMVKNVELRLKS